MHISIEQYEKLSHFLDAEMTMAEMESFEKELSINPALREQLNFELALRDRLAVKGIKLQKGNLQDNGTQRKIYKIGSVVKPAYKSEQNPSKKIGPHRYVWQIAAAAVLLIAIALFFIIKPKQSAQPAFVKAKETPVVTNSDPAIASKNKPDVAAATAPDFASLYKKYFVKDKLPKTYPMLLAEAFTKYENGDYASIQRLRLDDISESRGADEVNSKQNILRLGHYYKGLAVLETNNIQEAIANFNWVIKNQTATSLRVKAQWYLILAYLKENNKAKAAELCSIVIKNKENEALAKKAQALFDEIKN